MLLKFSNRRRAKFLIMKRYIIFLLSFISFLPCLAFNNGVIKKESFVNAANYVNGYITNEYLSLLSPLNDNRNYNNIINKIPNFINIRSKLEIEIEDNFISMLASSNQNRNTLPTVDGSKPPIDSSSNSNKFFSFEFNFISILFPILLVASLFYLFRTGYLKLDERIDRRITKNELDTYFNDQFKQKGNNTNNDRLDNLEKGFEILKEANIYPTKTEEIPKIIEPQVKKNPLVEVLYIDSPTRDGNFIESSFSKSFKPTISTYQFTKLENTDQAEFEIIDDSDTIQRALNYYDTLIKLVCDSENGFFPEAKKIVKCKPGVLLKEGDKWIVFQKAIIRYE